ncbi:MAG: type II toxin-antitoxin system HicA family toxin [Nitrososphaerota archaeon]|nr:type II toxin-antitoxin system HicA family toxin [Nitrososphaerota archaeon]MDG6924139.1 type II toxin-antitoxin system HicA family toxin [Nitrososphaerota archaeon]
MSNRRKPLHPVKAREILKTLAKLGFVARHTKGSHVFLRHRDGRTTVVPVHPSEDIDRSLFRKIAADISMNPEELAFLVDET